MRSAVAVLVAASLVGGGACSSSDYVTSPSSIGGADATEAKGGRGGGGGTGGTPVTGTWGTAPDEQATGISMLGTFDGAILDNAAFHAEGDDLGSISVSGLGDTTGGTLVLVHMNSVANLTMGNNPDASNPELNLGGTLGADGYAHQFVVAWKDGDNPNVTYRLQYGDVNTQPEPGIPNYGHVACTSGSFDGSSPCVAAVIDSKEGTYDSTVAEGTVSPRVTGPIARLLRQDGKRKPVVIGNFSVPFSLTVQ